MKHIPRKRFGQNFLIDQTIIQNIIDCLDLQPNDHWLEIGPGQGALTVPLLNKGIRLDVVELDRDLVALLKKKLGHHNQLQIHNEDALKFDISKLTDTDNKLHIVGNLPYNISTPLLFHLLASAPYINDMHFMLQKEVVDRICAEPGKKQYGRLSVMAQYYCQPEALFEVPPESFNPPPQVTSTIIRLIPYQQPPVSIDDFSLFSLIVTQTFSMRRKTLRNSLRSRLKEEHFSLLQIDPNKRAENVSLEEFARLSNFIGNLVHSDENSVGS